MVWTAKIPHSDKKTFFGYYREDGFVKRKKLGRIDAYGRWEDIKNEWLYLFQYNIEKPGLSVLKTVTHTDEWCAEAYMETDYTQLSDSDFERKIKEYVAFTFMNDIE